MLYPSLEENVRKYPDKVALQIKRNGEYVRYTYAQVLEWSKRFAGQLRMKGVLPGEHVALWAESVPEWGIAYLGLHFAGAVVVPMDVQYSEAVVLSLLKFAGAKAIVCAGELLPQARRVAQELRMEVFTVDQGGENSLFASPPAADFKAHPAKPDDTMSLIFTSGTTGDPKGVMLTCENLLSNARALIAEKWATENDVFLCVLPMHHCYAFTGTFITPILLGATVTYQPILKGPDILNAIQETGVTMMLGVPQLFGNFARAIQDKIQAQPTVRRVAFRLLYSIARRARLWFGWNLGKRFFGSIHARFGAAFRYFVSGGAKADPEVAEFFWNIGIPMLEGYGLTETSPVISGTRLGKFYPRSVGTALSGMEVRIDHPDASGVGEIVMRGPNLMKGYYKKEDATREVIRDGWFHTGDLGYLDKRKYLYITGRAKDVIVLDSGKNIYPDEVEKHYETNPLLKEVCVVAEKDGDGRVKSLCALVVPDMDEARRQKLSNIQVEARFQVENLSMKLPSYMRVTSCKIVGEPFPRTRLGKLKRNMIEQKYLGGQESEEAPPRQELSAEDMLLLGSPAAEKFLARLQKMLRYEKQIFPADSLELDLGIDSIKRVEMQVILEQEFGLKATPEDIGSYMHVRDILKCLPKSAEAQGEDFSWKSLLYQEKSPALGELFNLRRGRIKNFIIEIVRWICRIICRICFGLKIKGFSELAGREGAFLIAPSHQSYLDAVFLYVSLPEKILHRTLFIGIAQMFENWPLSWLVRPGRVIRTASSHTAFSSLQYAAQGLKKGLCVCIFPEGQRSPDGQLCPPMLGPGILSLECLVPMVPVVIEGAMATYSRPNPGFHFADVKMEALEPILPWDKAKFQDEDYRDVVNRWRETIAARIASREQTPE